MCIKLLEISLIVVGKNTDRKPIKRDGSSYVEDNIVYVSPSKVSRCKQDSRALEQYL